MKKLSTAILTLVITLGATALLPETANAYDYRSNRYYRADNRPVFTWYYYNYPYAYGYDYAANNHGTYNSYHSTIPPHYSTHGSYKVSRPYVYPTRYALRKFPTYTYLSSSYGPPRYATSYTNSPYARHSYGY